MTNPGDLLERLRSKYAVKVALLAVVITVAVVGIGFLTYTQVSERVKAEQLQTLETNTELEAQQFGQWIEGEKDSIRLLSTHRGIAANDLNRTRETLDAQLSALPNEVAALHLVERRPGEFSKGKNETIVASTNPEFEGQPLSVTNIKWNPDVGFNFESSNQTIQSWVYDDAGEPSVAVASPVPETEYALVAVYRTNVRAEEFSNSINGTETIVLGGTTSLVLFDQNKSNVLTQYKGDSKNTTVGQRILSTDPQANLSGSVLTDDSVIAYHRVPGDSDWVVVKEVPRASALSVQTAVQDKLMFLIGVAVLGFVALGIMVHRGPMRSLSELADQANAIAQGDLSVDIESSGRKDEIGQVRTAFRDMKDYVDTVALQAEAIADREFDADVLDRDVPGRLGQSMTEMNADIERFVDELETARRDAESAQQEAEALAEELQAQARAVSAVLERAAEGDLSQRVETDIDNDAMREIATALNEMLAEVETTIREIQAFSQEVAAASEEANAGAQEIKQASSEVSESVQTIATGTDDQREKLEDVSSEMNNFSAAIEEAASTAQTVASTSQETADIATDGERTAQEAITEMQAVQQTVASTVADVESLDDLMAEIDDIVDLIGDIAEQTNMLALNANIEAARAGTSGGAEGEGFAVVADEVKQLAGETQQSADEVARLIDDVQAQTETTVEQIRTAERRVEETTESVEDAVEAFVDVLENVEATDDGVQEISTAMEDQASSSADVVSMVDEVAEISRQTADEAETVSAAAEEQASSMTQVTSNIESLRDRAERLQEQLEQFTVDGTTDRGPATSIREGPSQGDAEGSQELSADGGGFDGPDRP